MQLVDTDLLDLDDPVQKTTFRSFSLPTPAPARLRSANC